MPGVPVNSPIVAAIGTAAPATAGHALAGRFYSEMAVGGFSHVDGSIGFYTQIAALLRPEFRVLDYGAGRGEQIADDPSPYRRALQNFQGRCAHVEGCDVAPAVLTNPYLDHAEIIDPAAALPYADNSFDLIVSRYVFEHVDDPEQVSRELLRVVRPGGWICAVTPNSYGYVAIASRLVPNRRHVAALKSAQPDRKAEDVFPTRYRLNTRAALQRYFGGRADIHVYRASAEPAYHFGKPWLYAGFKLLHRLLPDVLHSQLFIFMRKRAS